MITLNWRYRRLTFLGILALMGTAQGQSQRNTALPQTFSRADSDGNGVVSYQELKVLLPQLTANRFRFFDADRDGRLTGADFTPAQKNFRRPAAPDSPTAPKRPAGAANSTQNVSFGRTAFIARLMSGDADRNGSLTFEEARSDAPNLTQEIFARLDINDDGVLNGRDQLQWSQVLSRAGKRKARTQNGAKTSKQVQPRRVRPTETPVSIRKRAEELKKRARTMKRPATPKSYSRPPSTGRTRDSLRGPDRPKP